MIDIYSDTGRPLGQHHVLFPFRHPGQELFQEIGFVPAELSQQTLLGDHLLTLEGLDELRDVEIDVVHLDILGIIFIETTGSLEEGKDLAVQKESHEDIVLGVVLLGVVVLEPF